MRKDLRPGSLRVEVAGRPDPFLLRGAIEGHLAGRPVRPGPELAVAEAVMAEIERARETGTARRGNGAGISVGESVSGNVIGGTTPDKRNLISGNGSIGVLIDAVECAFDLAVVFFRKSEAKVQFVGSCIQYSCPDTQQRSHGR